MDFVKQIFRKITYVIMGVSLFSLANSSIGKDDEHVDHSMHRAMMNKTSFTVKEENYSVPNLLLLDRNGVEQNLKSLINNELPIALNFIFTTCTTICPVMTATFSQTQRKLGKDSERIQFISITIDPEYDRPEVLKEYADNFHSNSNWKFLTGSGTDIFKVTKSFKAYSGSKMNHRPVTYLKDPQKPYWFRIEGLVNGTDLSNEIRTRLLY